MTVDVRDYYRRITEVDIGEIARELLGERVVAQSGRRLLCDCPHHASQSKKSLNIMLDLQSWFCFGCGVGGDVLQLVEFIQSGEVTRGVSGPMPDSHRVARDFLAQRAELPPLGRNGTSPEEVAKAEAARTQELRVHGVLTAVADYYHQRLKATPEVMGWFRERYGISDETIEALKIAYAANGGEHQPGIINALTSGPGAFSLRDLSASGAFRPTPQDTLAPFFHERIIFPYWSRGRVVFLIGRKTPWTPDSEWEQAKYKKLPIHDEKERPYIAPCVKNEHLYNEDVLLTRPERLVITEGVTDCIALMQYGFPAVSPVTVRIRAADWGRLVRKLGGVKTVYVSQDNELSQAGLEGALQTARLLRDREVDTRLVILPLGKKQTAARNALEAQFGLALGITPKVLKERLAEHPESEIREAERLLDEAKIDVNEYFASGHTAEDFESLLADAKTPVELGISQLPIDVPEDERNKLLTPILREVARLEPLEQSRCLRLIHARYPAKTVSLGSLRQQINAFQRKERHEAKAVKSRAARRPRAPAGTCRAAIEHALIESARATGSPDHKAAAEAAYEWFASSGARFFRTSQGDPFMFFEDAILWMDGGGRGQRRLYEATIYKHTGIVPTNTAGRTFYAVLADLAAEHGEIRDHLSWLHTDVAHHAVYFNLNTSENEIAKITPEGVEIMNNGGNADGVILGTSQKMLPIRYVPDADIEEADHLVTELVVDNLTCAAGDRLLIVSWLSCFLLLDFTGTRPMTRFEGKSGSAKTTAAKLISALLYGEPQQKKSTDAANYTDGARNPLIVLDNIESRQMTEELTAFMLTCITGITKEKRKGGTDTETVVERTKCLLNTTGIEPLRGDLAEILSRSFIIEFTLDDHASDCFLEAKVLANIRQHRDVILSALMKRTSHVLAMIRDGAQERVMRLLHQALGNHNKRRANDYLSLMYLMVLAGKPPEDAERHLEALNSSFLDQIASLNSVTMVTARESNPIATALAALFNGYRRAVTTDRQRISTDVRKTDEEAFLDRYQLEFEDEYTIRGALAREMFVALTRFAKDYGLSFPMRSVQQFAQRFSNDLDTVREAGFDITVTEFPNRVRTYDVRLLNHLPVELKGDPFNGENLSSGVTGCEQGGSDDG